MKLLQQTLLALLLFVSSAYLSLGIELKKEVLRGTKQLTLEGDLAERMLVGAHRFLDRKLAETLVRRSKHWEKGLSSPKKKEGFLDDNRKELARILGVTYKRVPFEAPSLMSTTTRSAKVTTGSGYEVLAIRWPVLEGVFGEGLLLQPTGRKPVANVLAIPDADQSPEDIAGLTTSIPPAGQFARRLAESGCRVVVPALVGRNVRVQSERRKGIKISDREFLHRSAFLMGRTLQGLEIQKVLALVDWFEREKEKRIGLIGWGEGGLLALQAGALDPRIDAVCVSGHFGPREDMWREPLERNLFGFLNHLGDAELAGLLSDRALVMEAAKGPEVVIDSTGAAPGRLTTPTLANVRDEFSRANVLVSSGKSDFSLFSSGDNGKGPPGESQALLEFLQSLSPVGHFSKRDKTQKTTSTLPDSKAREERAFRGIAAHVQELVEKSHLVRTSDFQPDLSSLDAYAKSTVSHRRRFEEEVIGRGFPPSFPSFPKNIRQGKMDGPRSRSRRVPGTLCLWRPPRAEERSARRAASRGGMSTRSGRTPKRRDRGRPPSLSRFRRQALRERLRRIRTSEPVLDGRQVSFAPKEGQPVRENTLFTHRGPASTDRTMVGRTPLHGPRTHRILRTFLRR
jgi:hypothetical protein